MGSADDDGFASEADVAMATHADGGASADAARPSAAAVAAGLAPVAAGGAGTGPVIAAEHVHSKVYVKVGDIGKYVRFRKDWEDVRDMEADQLIMALKDDDVFKLAFKDVVVHACTVSVFKPAALGDAREPTPALETDDNVVTLNLDESVGVVANNIGESVHGARLFVRVHLPRE